MIPALLTVNQTAAVLGVCRQTVSRMVREGRLESVRLTEDSATPRIPRRSVAAFLGYPDDAEFVKAAV